MSLGYRADSLAEWKLSQALLLRNIKQGLGQDVKARGSARRDRRQ